jgi:hypothetical protein
VPLDPSARLALAAAQEAGTGAVEGEFGVEASPSGAASEVGLGTPGPGLGPGIGGGVGQPR